MEQHWHGQSWPPLPLSRPSLQLRGPVLSNPPRQSPVSKAIVNCRKAGELPSYRICLFSWVVVVATNFLQFNFHSFIYLCPKNNIPLMKLLGPVVLITHPLKPPSNSFNVVDVTDLPGMTHATVSPESTTSLPHMATWSPPAKPEFLTLITTSPW